MLNSLVLRKLIPLVKSYFVIFALLCHYFALRCNFEAALLCNNIFPTLKFSKGALLCNYSALLCNVLSTLF